MNTTTQHDAALHQNGWTGPVLYLSSDGAGWDGLRAQAFHEPRELEGWVTSTSSDVSLILFAGGALHIEQRQVNGPWRSADLHESELLLRPGTGEAYEVRWMSLSDAPTQTLHLHLSKDFLTRTADDDRVSFTARTAFHDPLLQQIGLALWRELADGAPAGKLYAQSAAQMIAAHLLRHYTDVRPRLAPRTSTLSPRQVRRVTDFVRANAGEPISLDALAAQVGFSPYHFAWLFRQTLGESPHQFVLRRRIEAAQVLLRETELPLAAVALESGFANQSHLTRHFKRLTGITPRAYRQSR